MSVIYCKIDLFDYDQTIFIQKNGKLHPIAKIPMEHLASFVAKYCQENDVEEIHLVGYPEFSVDIKNQIMDINKTKYNNRVVNIYMDKKVNDNE